MYLLLLFKYNIGENLDHILWMRSKLATNKCLVYAKYCKSIVTINKNKFFNKKISKHAVETIRTKYTHPQDFEIQPIYK